MSRTRRLAIIEAQALAAWLREEASRLGLSMDEAWRQSAIWDEQLRRYGVHEGDLLPTETIECFLREFAHAAAPETDPEVYVTEVMTEWGAAGPLVQGGGNAS